AGRLALEKGTIVSRKFTAGIMTTTNLTIASLRPGSWEDVFRDVSEQAYMAGYNEQPANRCKPGSRSRRTAIAANVPARDLCFWAPAWRGPSQVTFPQLVVSIYPPGEAIGRDRTIVPAGQTGLMLSLCLSMRCPTAMARTPPSRAVYDVAPGPGVSPLP